MPELLGQLERALGTTYRHVRGLGGGMSRVVLAEEIALGATPRPAARMAESN